MTSLCKIKFKSLNIKVKSNRIKLVLVPVFFWIIFFDFSQSESIVVNPTLIYMHVHDVVDTAVSSYTPFGCATKSYKLDVDQNNVTDFTLTTSCYMGGSGADKKITLSSSDSSYFAIDTNVIDTIGSIVAGQIVYNPAYFSLVKAYEWNDSIKMEECNQQAVKNIVDYSCGYFPSFISYHSMDSWISGDHYIGFRKQINGINHLGWIKLSVSNYNQFVVKEYALSFLDSPFIVYPNPVNESVTIQCGYTENSELKIYNSFGVIIYQSTLSKGVNQINLEQLNQGIYTVQISGLDHVLMKQILKL